MPSEKRVFKVLGALPLNFDLTLINIFVDMIHQHWVAASLFTVFVVHGAEPPPADPQGHEEITGGAFNETGDLFLTSFGHIFPGSQAPVGPPVGPQVRPPVAGIPFCSLS